MKKSNIPLKDKQKDSTPKWRAIAIAAVAIGTAAVIALAFILPIVKINSDLDKLLDRMQSTSSPSVTITDMGAENVFGPSKGEITVVSGDLVAELCRLCEDFRYEENDKNSLGAFDIRLRVADKDGFSELYLDEDEIYYVKGGVYYYFEPKNDKVEKEYEAFYENIKKMLEE